MGWRAAADRSEPACRLVRFEATDGIGLAGLLYEPEKRTDRAVIWLHGTGGSSIFESRRTNLLARTLVDHGVAFFPFNNRGAHIVRRIGQDLGGAAFEKIRECVPDIDGAVRELWRRGYREIVLAGHSTGANKIAVYDHEKRRNRIRGYILVAGGDDVGLMVDQLGVRGLKTMLSKAKREIAARRGKDFVPRTLSDLPMTWQAMYDLANPDGSYNVFPFHEAIKGPRISRKPLFHLIREIRKRSLYIYGQLDEYAKGNVAAFAECLSQYVGEKSEIVVLEGADHGFTGHEHELGRLIVEWMDAG